MAIDVRKFDSTDKLTRIRIDLLDSDGTGPLKRINTRNTHRDPIHASTKKRCFCGLRIRRPGHAEGESHLKRAAKAGK